jgi:hypothetical protein
VASPPTVLNANCSEREVLKIGHFFPTIHDMTAAQDTTLVKWGLFRKHYTAWKDVYKI